MVMIRKKSGVGGGVDKSGCGVVVRGCGGEGVILVF